MKSYCKLDFHEFGVPKLNALASEVRNGIYANTGVFATPPVTLSEYEHAQSVFAIAAADYKKYGITEKVSFVEARNNLIIKLDRMADYVDVLSEGDVSLIALAGFMTRKDRFKRVDSINKIEEFAIKKTNVLGKVIVEIPAIVDKGSVNYGCLCIEGAPLRNTTLINGQFSLATDGTEIYQDCNKSRKKVFQVLKPGTQYYFYVFASNSISVSPLSDYKIAWGS